MARWETKVVNIKHGDKYDRYIGRPGKWGNPYSHLDGTRATYRVASREEAVSAYRAYLTDILERDPEFLVPLKGMVLGCYCKPLACHGDILVQILNAESA